MSGGARGECPDWYTLLRAARYLGVPPWELAERPVGWQQVALAAEGAESWAQEELAKRARARSG